MSAITLETLRRRADLEAAVDDLARLRISVFREWPYLYDGSLAYEQQYLAGFMDQTDAAMIVARDGGVIVGAATAAPMSGQEAAFRAPFETGGKDITTLFYFGESVLLPAYRGHGLGHAFFDAREAAARTAGANAACFCGVIRPVDHALRPTNARDLAPFWRKRGYAPVEGLIGHYEWKDIDQPTETSHPMQFWYRAL